MCFHDSTFAIDLLIPSRVLSGPYRSENFRVRNQLTLLSPPFITSYRFESHITTKKRSKAILIFKIRVINYVKA
ncbi:hypothetical protein LRA02_17210 [Lentilactobacillus rapi]|uniref:Uncharacterized protein n=1 Tax=Lentilactobacillus rapi TaxID=481723 RepID=A0A512PNV8_9LACO|nr:hypothetical protein LRA02_17210 [Lentilactobacillus rapi]